MSFPKYSSLTSFVHLFALLFYSSDCELWFTINCISKKSIVNPYKMSTLRVNFLAASLPRIPVYLMLFFLFDALFSLRVCRVEHHGSALSWSRCAGQRRHPILVCETFFWFRFTPRTVHKCNRSLLDSNREEIENIALLVLFRTTRITLHFPPNSRIIICELLLNGL